MYFTSFSAQGPVGHDAGHAGVVLDLLVQARGPGPRQPAGGVWQTAVLQPPPGRSNSRRSARDSTASRLKSIGKYSPAAHGSSRFP